MRSLPLSFYYTTPEVFPEGHIILYHGTTLRRAKSILHEKTLKQTPGWGIGICTSCADALSFALMKAKEEHDVQAVIKLTIEPYWLSCQTIESETGGRGRNKFIIKGNIIPEAIIDCSLVKF